MEQQHSFIKPGKVVASNDPVAPQVDPPDASELISDQPGEGQGRHKGIVHALFVSGSEAA
jgi:hypothetical protein